MPEQSLRKIDQLKEEKLLLSFQVNHLQYLKYENEHLKKALNFYEDKKISFISAEVISFDPSIWRRIVILNAGKDKGVEQSAYVVDEEGWLLGKIIETASDYSRLIFVDDSEFIAQVFINKDSFGLLKGGIGRIKVLYIEANEEVNAGDKIWLQVPSLNFPLYAGEVQNAKRNINSLFWDIDVRLFSQHQPFQKVFIVK